jgi:Cd2+/Zn2+-exporting ATPase/Cu+-exporting ATPase
MKLASPWGAAGRGVAMEAAHIVLLRDDWSLIPHAMRIARRTMRVVRINIGFTAIYNLVGLALAAWGFSLLSSPLLPNPCPI